MNPDLKNLPPPPTGQQGVTFESLQHLPPPPQGQQGFTLDQIKGQTITPQPEKKPNYFQRVGQSFSDIGSRIVSGVKKGAGQFSQGVEQANTAPTFSGQAGGIVKATGGLLRSGLRTVGGVAEGAFAPIMEAPGIKQVTEAIGGAISNTGVGQKLSDLQKRHPESAQDIQDLISLATLGGGKIAEKPVASALDKGLTKVDTEIAGEMGRLDQRTATRATDKASQKITEMISPNPTATEAQLAQRQGRLVEGKDRTFFRSETPTKILPSEKVKSATQTIIKNIPDAAKKKPSELFKAVEEKIGGTAKALRPQMEATPIKPETIQKINSDWQTLKKSQIDAAPATEEPNVAKRQVKFEAFLKKSDSEHQGHLWDARIAYDNSVLDAVKKATTDSSESLQLQKDEWLQNRDILNKAINDTANGMGKASQQAFKTMTDLYEARTNLQSKAKVTKTVQASKLHEALTGRTAKTIRAAAIIGGGTLGVYKVAKTSSK